MKNSIHAHQAAEVISYSNGVNDLPKIVLDQLAQVNKDDERPIVAVCYYGGTLGMVADEHGALIPTNDAGRLLEPLTVKGLSDKVQIIWFQVCPDAIDSTCGRWFHWASIGNAIHALYEHVDGYVVLGGTDTMAHLTVSMSYMFPNTGKPIIATGAQLPMIELGDDATRNFYFAIACAMNNLSGVHLAFADCLYDGRFVTKVADKDFRAFDSPQRHIIGNFNGEVRLFSAPQRQTFVTKERLVYEPTFREGVKVVRLCPGTPSESLEYDANDPLCSVLLVLTYGAGNVRDVAMFEGEQHHVQILKKLHQKGYPVVLGSPMQDGKVDSPYRSGAKAVDTKEGGAISGYDTCGPALEVKIQYCIARCWDTKSDKLDVLLFREMMDQNIIGELNH